MLPNQFTATAAGIIERSELTDEQNDAVVDVINKYGGGLVFAVDDDFFVATRPGSIGYVFTARLR